MFTLVIEERAVKYTELGNLYRNRKNLDDRTINFRDTFH